jgi:hypothetical protein
VRWAFGIPGIAMVIATIFFWAGRNKMVHVPPRGLGYLKEAFLTREGLTILARIAEKPEDIDVKRAETAKKRAEERLARPTVDMDVERARISLMKALIRLQVASRARTRA